MFVAVASELKICVARVPRFIAAEAGRSSQLSVSRMSFDSAQYHGYSIDIDKYIYPLLANFFINILQLVAISLLALLAPVREAVRSVPFAATLLPVAN